MKSDFDKGKKGSKKNLLKKKHLSKRRSLLEKFIRCLKEASDKDRRLLKVKGGKMGTYVPVLERGLAQGREEGKTFTFYVSLCLFFTTMLNY